MNIWPGVHFISFEFNFSRIWRGLVFSWVCTIRGRSHIAPKNVWKTLGALLSPFFQSARAVALRRRLSLLSNHQLRSPLQEGNCHMTCGALAAFWKVEMFLSRCGADAPGKNERVTPRLRRFHYERTYRASIFEITNLSAQKTRYVSGPLKRLSCPSASFLLFLAPVSSSAHYLQQLFPRSDFVLLSNECVLKCSEVQYFPQNILK